MKFLIVATGAMLLAVTAGRPLPVQPPATPLMLDLQDCAATTPTSSANARASVPGQNAAAEAAATFKNSVPATPESIAAGTGIFDANCAACHGNAAQGAVKAGLTISIIEEQHGSHPISPTMSGITDRATARSSPPLRAGCRRR